MYKFTKEEQEKFKRDLQQINLDSQSDLEDSFYAKQMTRLQQELKSVKNAKNDNKILAELKKNIEREDEMITEYQQDITQLQRITKNEEMNVIDDKILNQIKIKIAQSNNNSVLQLADEEYNQSVVKKQLENPAPLKNFTKKTVIDEIKKEEKAIDLKIQKANVQRQQLAMEQEDKLSMKNQLQYLSQLFSQRFFRPKLKKLEQKDTKIQLTSTKLRNTFSNLAPQVVNEANILPRNSPQIALKQLKQNKRKALKSISQTSVKTTGKKILNNPEIFEEVALTVKSKNEDQKQNLQSQFIKYISFITNLVGPLEFISKNYNPKFLQYLQQKQKNINFDYSEEKSNNKQKYLSQVASLQNAKDLKELKLTFQSITNLKGIEHFNGIQNVQIQFNALNIIAPISNCKNIIQLNLSHNKIKDISELLNLPWLRLLNLDHNIVRQLSLRCESLQILLVNNNVVEDLDINSCKYLRVLSMKSNKLNQLPKLKLYNLQELDLSRNQLKSIKNLQNLILLKKLDFSYNRLQKIDEKLIYLYLNVLNLSNNYIQKLNFLFLPCLEHLYLNNNRIGARGRYQIFLPNLKQMNIDENRLQGFSAIWQLLLYSRKLQYLRYSNNEYFLSLREKARQVYEYIIYKYMRNIKILNESNMDIGIKKYYESNYQIYYNNIDFFKSSNNIIKFIQNNINFILHQFTFARALQKDRSSFIKQKQYIYYQSIQKIKQLKLTINFIQQYSQQKSTIISIDSSLFYHHDQFQMKRRNFYHHIRGLVIKTKYRKNKRFNYYHKIKHLVQDKTNLLLILYYTSQITKAVRKFKNLLRGLTENQAAIKIQKIWRGYIRRKLYKKLKQLRKNNKINDDSDFEDVDTDFFNQQLQRHQFKIENIEGINFQDVIIRPQVFQYLQKRQKQETKPNKSKEIKQQKNLLVNNFIESQTKFKKKQGKPTQQQQMIKEWGIKDQKLLKTLQYKQQKRAEARKKQEDKLLTATQRYERFKRGGV